MTEVTSPRTAPPDLRRSSAAVHVVGLALAACGGAVIAYLVAGQRPEVAVGLLLAAPVGYLVLRQPLSVVAIWIAVTPFLMVTEGGAFRPVYWVVHRALPLVALVLVVADAIVRERRLPRSGWPELAMGGYVVVSLVSIMSAATSAAATTIHTYDRVVIPMCLYLLVRLLLPEERHLRAVLPVVVLLLITQAGLGILAWVAPDVLPSVWMERAGLRTTGSLRHPNVYGVTLLLGGLFVLHHALNRTPRPPGRWPLLLLFPVALIMVFLTYSRASWLAALVAMVGLAVIHPRFTMGMTVTATLVIALLVSAGLLSDQVGMAKTRFHSQQSEESALSRLPVAKASLAMFAQKPLTGWGMGNFDRFSPRFQGRVSGIVVPDKDHASHNLYLTILAEQGIVGLLLYLAPVLWLLRASPTAYRRLPRDGLVSRDLLVVLWLAIAGQVVVNSYSNMRVVFGLGMFWLSLGMIASLVSRNQLAPAVAAQMRADRATLTAALAASRRQGRA